MRRFSMKVLVALALACLYIMSPLATFALESSCTCMNGHGPSCGTDGYICLCCNANGQAMEFRHCGGKLYMETSLQPPAAQAEGHELSFIPPSPEAGVEVVANPLKGYAKVQHRPPCLIS